ncbi:DUF6053 domain-containing protein [Lysobacter capsici]|uniref:DUF6053 domain-containing protein n=1 Tax=Lysobacter capsici TaxID=435897 RepID=UPI003D2F8CC7
MGGASAPTLLFPVASKLRRRGAKSIGPKGPPTKDLETDENGSDSNGDSDSVGEDRSEV